jgi:hypothetical protein
MKKTLVSTGFRAVFLLISTLCHSQNNIHFQDSEFQYGFSAKIVADLSFPLEKCNIRASIVAGAGYLIYPANLVSTHLEFSGAIGGLGTYRNGTTSYIVGGINTTQSFGDSSQETSAAIYRNQPLYYFTDLSAPPLQNPFRNSIAMGMNWVRYFNKHQREEKFQRIAFLGAKINVVHIVYSNDGGALLKFWGDGKDRYLTGGGFVNVHLNEDTAVNKFGISFYKFTGFNEMSFEVSDELFFSSVDYREVDQNYFNKGFWGFSAGNTSYGDVFMRINNPKNIGEVQNFIHYAMGFGYHQNLEDPYLSFGGSVSFLNSYIPKK